MDHLETIDIEGKSLALTKKELDKLTTPDGCHLQVVTNKVLKLEDDTENDEFSDDEVDNLKIYIDDDEIDTDATTMKKVKEDRMRREYISLIMNANGDPLEPGSRFKSRDIYTADPAVDTNKPNHAHDFSLNNLDEKYVGVHKMYEELGRYELYMAKHSFQEVFTGLVYKLTRVPGVGECAKVGQDSLVMYDCALWTEGNRNPFDSSWLRRTTITTDMAQDSILPGIRELLLSTQQGELCEAFIKPEAAFGPLGAKPRIPANATIFCLLHVVRVVPRDKIAKILPRPDNEEARTEFDNDDGSISSRMMSLKFEDFLEASNEARRRGNYYSEHKQLRIALQRYKSAIRLLEGLSYADEHQEAQANELLVKLYNNCARTFNALNLPRAALGACKQAGLIADDAPKTYWHKMTAWAKMGHYDRALGISRRAMQLFTDRSISKPFARAADDYKYKIQQEQNEVDDLHKLMGQALLSSA